jgi:hypothetical protein
LFGSKIVANLENITNIEWGKEDHVHAIVCFDRAHEAMCGAFNLILEELKYPKSSAVCVREAVMASAAISGPLPIKIRSRAVIDVHSSTSAYRSPANSKLFNEVTTVIRAQLSIIPVAASNGLASLE